MLDHVLECIKTRRSIRKYTDQQISEKQLATLLEAATWAPSGSNNQSWLFTAIQSEKNLVQLNETMRRAFLVWTPDDDYPSKKKAVINAQNENHSYFYKAPTLIIASNKPGYANGMADCALALQNIFLTAHAMGLGSCWVNQLRWLRDVDAVRDFLTPLGLPREHIIYGAAIVGHPAHSPKPSARKEGTTGIVR